MRVLADCIALGHGRDHRRAEVLRMRAREADPLDPLDRVDRAQELPELGANLREEDPDPTSSRSGRAASPRVPRRRRGPSPQRRSLLGGGSARVPRTAGTMQYEQTELQPIEICTQAWNARSRRVGRSPAKWLHSAKLPRETPSRPRRASRRDAGSNPGRTRRRRTDRARRCARAAPPRSSLRPRSRAPGPPSSAPPPARGARRSAGRASRAPCRC